jgi:hypothetical protein
VSFIAEPTLAFSTGNAPITESPAGHTSSAPLVRSVP